MRVPTRTALFLAAMACLALKAPSALASTTTTSQDRSCQADAPPAPALGSKPAGARSVKPRPLKTIEATGKNGAIPLARGVGSVRVRNAYRVIETGDIPVDGAVIDGLRADGIQREGIRLKGAVSNVTIRNFSLLHGPVPNVAPHLPEGIHVEDGVEGVVIEHGVICGFQMELAPDRYWNGDGLAVERVGSITIRDVLLQDNTDGGLDTKAEMTILDDVTARGNNRNFRFWRDVQATTITSIEPLKRGGNARSAHLHVAGSDANPPNIQIDRLVVRATTSTAPVWLIENGAASVTIGSCELDVPPGTRWSISARVTWKLGPGCSLPEPPRAPKPSGSDRPGSP